MPAEPKLDLGILVQRFDRHGTTRIEVRPMAREPGKDSPCGFSYSAWDAGTEAADVTLDGWIHSGMNNDRLPEYVPSGVACTLDGAHLSRVKAAATTLARVAKQIAKDDATEPGDVFLSFARAIGAKWIVFPRKRSVTGSSWEDTKWIWYGLTDGRNAYRSLIAESISQATEGQTVRIGTPVAA